MSAIRKHCRRAIYLDAGRVVADGDVNYVLDRYEEMNQAPGKQTSLA